MTDTTAHDHSIVHPEKGILFVCRGNAVRSQMAEGLYRAKAGPDRPVWSAGQHPIGLSKEAAQVMGEIGIDISAYRSKGVDAVPLENIGLVVVLCGGSHDPCPTVSNAIPRLNWPLPDPYMATAMGSGGLDGFRAVRDELSAKIDGLLHEEEMST